MISFRVPSLPIAQPRPKATAFNGRAKVYDDKKHPVNTFKAAVQMVAYQHHIGAPLEGPLSVVLTFVFASKSKRERKWKATRPDVDNLTKSVLDALNGLTFKDDGQVCELVVRKYHACGDEQPHVDVSINEI